MITVDDNITDPFFVSFFWLVLNVTDIRKAFPECTMLGPVEMSRKGTLIFKRTPIYCDP